MFQPVPIGGNAAEYYTEKLGADDYYVSGHEPPGILFGKGIEHLGLKEGDRITREIFVNLFRGFTPNGDGKLVQNAGSYDRQAGWDGVFSLGKDISVAWARGTPEERAEIERIALEKVKEVVRHFEENYLFSRIGKAGEERIRANLIAAIFPHYL